MFRTLALLLPSSFALAQAVPGDGQAASSALQPLLRIERLQSGEAVCALINDDGTYRLEKLFRAKAEMYTGKAGNDQVAELTQILGNAQLRSLSQEKVLGEMVSDTLDALDLAIWRQRGWQTLSFHNPSSRKPFKDELDPLLKWFQNLQKSRPAAVRVEGAATRCLPPKELRVETSQTTEPKVATASSEPKYLFRFSSSEFAHGRVEGTCTIVFPDGTYRREKRFQQVGGSKADRSYGGQVGSDSLQVTGGSKADQNYGGHVGADSLAELKHLLDSSDLKKAHSDTGKEQWAGDLAGSSVYIPRENETQHLVFASEFNAHIRPLDQGGMSNMAYHVAGEKVLDPLKHWMKQHTDKLEGGGETDTATLNDCFPSKGK